MKFAVMISALVLFSMSGCQCDYNANFDLPDAGGDTDTNFDSDTGSSADGDSDSDSDSDADSDADADGDSDGDSDGDNDGDSDADADGDSDGDSDSDADADGDSDADSDGDSDTGSGSDTGSETNSDSNPDGGGDAGNDGGTELPKLYATMNPLSGEILVDGTNDNLASSYNFHSMDEARVIRKLDVINDFYGEFGDVVEQTISVFRITIRYSDINDVEQTRSGYMSNGRASFSNLGFFVPKDGMATIEVYVDTCDFSVCGEGIHNGFRVGVDQDTSFMAVGEESAEVQDFFEIEGSVHIPAFGVRRSRPFLDEVPGATVLMNGINTLYGITISADPEGDLVLVDELYFEIDGTVQISNFELWRGANLTTATFDYTTNDLAVSFDPLEGILSGQSQTYYLRAEVTGVHVGDYVNTFPIGVFWKDESDYYNIMSTYPMNTRTLSN